jgi:DNA-binding winged helix-turn-helix (wHTH) protein
VIRVGAFEIDLARSCIRFEGVECDVRPKVFDVLLFLVDHRNRMTTKQEIMASVWKDTTVSEDVLFGCIGALRELFKDDPKHPKYIKTVNKKGYRLIAPVTWGRAGIKWKRLLIPLAAVLIVLVLWAALRPKPPVVSRAEVAWWEFEKASGSSVADSSGNSNVGVLRGAAKYGVGIVGRALEFDGVTGFVRGANGGSGFPSGDEPRSVVCWLRFSQPPADDTGIFHYGSVDSKSPAANFHLYIDTHGFIGWGNGYGYGTITGATSLADNRWHHVAATYTGGLVEHGIIYVDGKVQIEGRLPLPAHTRIETPWTIGVFMGGGRPLQGSIDDLRVYAIALKNYDVKALYGCTKPEPDLQLPIPGKGYFLSAASDIELEREPAGLNLAHYAGGFGALQFAVSNGRCALKSLQGAAMPRDFRIGMDVSVPKVGRENSRSGPFFGAPPLRIDQDLGKSAGPGYWLSLNSKGVLELWAAGQIMDGAGKPIASSIPLAGFDCSRFHRLEIQVRNGALSVMLDASPARLLDRSGAEVLRLKGLRAGCAGVAFLAPVRPLFSTPQKVRNVRVSRM